MVYLQQVFDFFVYCLTYLVDFLLNDTGAFGIPIGYITLYVAIYFVVVRNFVNKAK